MRPPPALLLATLVTGCALKPPPPPPLPDESVRTEVNRPDSLALQACGLERDRLRGELDAAVAARDAALAKARTIAGLAEAMTQAARAADHAVYVIRFGDNDAELRLGARARETLVAAARRAGAVVVRGYTDAAADSTRAASLARQRASRVQAFLIAEGVPASNVTSGYQTAGGLLVDNSTPEGRALNRRVEVELRAAPPGRTLLDDAKE